MCWFYFHDMDNYVSIRKDKQLNVNGFAEEYLPAYVFLTYFVLLP